MKLQYESKIRDVQKNLTEEGVSGWLLYDFHHSNFLAHRFLEIPPEKKVTRRFFYWIPKQGEPLKIVSSVEPFILDHLPGSKKLFKTWQELEKLLLILAGENPKIAMEYSPYNALPTVSKVDAGTVELIRKCGAEVVSSANILQRYTSQWSPQQFQSHLAAAKVLEEIVDETWAHIELSLQHSVPISEFEVQQWMLKLMDEKGCFTSDSPTCAVNEHSSDPHYLPTNQNSSLIKKEDFILLDLWCKLKGPHTVYADITRVGVASRHPTQKQNEIFNLVKNARDHATQFIQESYENNKLIQGWEVDRICRDFIEQKGYGDYFVHRTGHNIGEEVHGPGANLDDYETHDYRYLLPCTAFSVEPGIYLPEFGVRLEYNIYLDSKQVIRITGGIQKELVCMDV